MLSTADTERDTASCSQESSARAQDSAGGRDVVPKALFVLSTAGIAGDGWTIYINGVVDSGLMVNVDLVTKIPKTQRRGRASRVDNRLYCCLT